MAVHRVASKNVIDDQLLPYHPCGESTYGFLGRAYELEDFTPATAVTLHGLRSILNETFGRSGVPAVGQWCRLFSRLDGFKLSPCVGVPTMSIGFDRPLVLELRHGLNALRGNWFWFVLLGGALVVLGVIALGSVVIASLAAAVAIGTLLLLGGVAEAVGAFWCRGWSGFFLHLLSGVLSIVVGVLFLRAPVGALAALTLLMACFLMVGGIFKIVAALELPVRGVGLAAGQRGH